jgi:16S rRNA (uracil1498-N3)-methyltransferase
MAHVHRFYIPPGSEAGFEIPLPPDEAHHAVHVVRVRSGERVVLFDGQGREIEGSVSRLTQREVFILPGAEQRVPAPTVQVTLLQAWLLREKSIEYLIQHGTEIGISQFCFFRARHSEKAPRLNARWQRYAIEACKQCARAWLPTFQVVADLNAALDLVRGPLLIATQAFAPVPIAEALRGVGETCSSITLLAGPEGDFSPEELQLASDHAAIPISLGEATYRSEVAATLAASLILYELGSLGPTSTRPRS